MDAETKAYLDGWRAEILTAMNVAVSRVARPSDPPRSRADPDELEDRILSLEERFRTMQLRMDLFERRVMDRLHARSVG